MALATPICRPAVTLLLSLGLLAQASHTLASPTDAEAGIAASAQSAFQAAQLRYQKNAGQTNAAWQFARACFDLADLATNNAQRASLAEAGIAASRQAVANQSNSAPAHYYLALNLGQLARTRGLSALRLVDQMQHEFFQAEKLDPHLDSGGPDRGLGLLYRDAPPIASVGSRTRAREHLLRAVELAPQFPENRLSLIEAYVKWGERNSAARELKALEAAWPRARTNYTGQTWTADWADWELRLGKLKKKVGQPAKSLGAPRGRE